MAILNAGRFLPAFMVQRSFAKTRTRKTQVSPLIRGLLLVPVFLLWICISLFSSTSTSIERGDGYSLQHHYKGLSLYSIHKMTLAVIFFRKVEKIEFCFTVSKQYSTDFGLS